MPIEAAEQPDERFAKELQAQLEARADVATYEDAAPNFGHPVVPHIVSFSGLSSAMSRTYMQPDLALQANLDNARYMENDLGIWSALEQRQRLMSLLPWHLEPEDPKSHEQKELCDTLTKLLNRIRRFTAMRHWLQDAIWRGRSAVTFEWRRTRIGGREYTLPLPGEGEESIGWTPVNGDKLIFRYDVRDTTAEQFPVRGLNGEVLGGVGFRCNRTMMNDAARPYILPTNQGDGYFPPPWARSLFMIHKHDIRDAMFFNSLEAGSIHGVGIRSRIYAEWLQKQELTALMMEYAERSALGIEIWEYPLGNAKAEAAVAAHAMNRRGGSQNVILFPKPQGEDAGLFDVRHVEPGLAGLQAIQSLLTEYFGRRCKLYILGQTLSSEAEATGLGSGLADLHLDTLMNIVEYDANNHEETITHELLKWLIRYNFPAASDIHVQFRIDTKTPDAQKRMEGYMQAYQMGARIKESDVLNLIGAAVPTESDVILQQQAQQPPDASPDPSHPAVAIPPNSDLSSRSKLHQHIAAKVHQAVNPAA